MASFALANMYVRISANVSGVISGMEKAQRSVQKFVRYSNRAADSSRALALGVAAVGAAAGVATLKGVALAGQVEQSEIAFEKMLGSAERADEFLRDLWDFAERTPFDFAGLQESAKLLMAMSFEAEEVVPIMTAVGDATAAVGGGGETIARIVRALGQMRMKGKVSAEEMLQLAEAGIDAWGFLAESIGTDVPAAMKLAEQGAIPASRAINGIVEGMGEEFEGLMDRQSESLLGLWSTLQDNMIGQGGVLAAFGDEATEAFDLKNHIKGAIAAVSRLNSIMRSGGIAGVWDALFPPHVQAIVTILAGAITGALIPAFISLAISAWAAVAPLLPFIAAGAAVGAVAYLVYKNWQKVEKLFFGVADVFGFAMKPIFGLVNFVGRAFKDIRASGVKSMDNMGTAVQDVSKRSAEKTTTFWGSIVTAVGNAWQWFLDLTGQKPETSNVDDFVYELKSSVDDLQHVLEDKRPLLTVDTDMKPVDEFRLKLSTDIDGFVRRTETGMTELKTSIEDGLDVKDPFDDFLDRVNSLERKLGIATDKSIGEFERLKEGATKETEDTTYNLKSSWEKYGDWLVMHSWIPDVVDRSLKWLGQFKTLAIKVTKDTTEGMVREWLRMPQMTSAVVLALDSIGRKAKALPGAIRGFAVGAVDAIKGMAKNYEEFAQTAARSIVQFADDVFEKKKKLKDFGQVLKDIVIQFINMVETQVLAAKAAAVATAIMQAPITFGASLALIPGIIAESIGAIAVLEGLKGVVRGMATGGIVTGPTMAMVGEGGDDEAVIPLNRRTLQSYGLAGGGDIVITGNYIMSDADIDRFGDRLVGYLRRKGVRT